jgi:hypothetical protein
MNDTFVWCNVGLMQCHSNHLYCLVVTGTWILWLSILGIVTLTDQYFSEGWLNHQPENMEYVFHVKVAINGGYTNPFRTHLDMKIDWYSFS